MKSRKRRSIKCDVRLVPNVPVRTYFFSVQYSQQTTKWTRPPALRTCFLTPGRTFVHGIHHHRHADALWSSLVSIERFLRRRAGWLIWPSAHARSLVRGILTLLVEIELAVRHRTTLRGIRRANALVYRPQVPGFEPPQQLLVVNASRGRLGRAPPLINTQNHAFAAVCHKHGRRSPPRLARWQHLGLHDLAGPFGRVYSSHPPDLRGLCASPSPPITAFAMALLRNVAVMYSRRFIRGALFTGCFSAAPPLKRPLLFRI